MIKAKHFLDRIDTDDGPRLWIEPLDLTKDLQEWCSVDFVMPHLGPPRELSEWFVSHPTEYDVFRGQYHRWLSRGPYRPAFQRLACECVSWNLTFLHASDADHNCAIALRAFISELEADHPGEQNHFPVTFASVWRSAFSFSENSRPPRTKRQ